MLLRAAGMISLDVFRRLDGEKRVVLQDWGSIAREKAGSRVVLDSNLWGTRFKDPFVLEVTRLVDG